MWTVDEVITLQDLVQSGPDLELDNGIDINDSGQIVGQARDPEKMQGRGFLLEDGVLTDLGTLGGHGSSAEAINSLGIVVGQAWTDMGQNHAYRWEEGEMVDLGTLGGRDSRATDINDLDQIVGGAQSTTSPELAVLWEDGEMIELGTLGGNQSNANGINNLGQIIGFSTDEIHHAHAFFWEEGVMYNLLSLIPPDQGWGGRANAHGINNAGQIVGIAYREDGDHGFVATRTHLKLEDPVPGIAGMVNTISVTEASPGARIYLVWGLNAGMVQLPGCAGATILINRPLLIGSVTANEHGKAEFSAYVPSKIAGRPIRIQTLEPGACHVSNVVVHTF
jgi:probable HAF family extracellular repeat protein